MDDTPAVLETLADVLISAGLAVMPFADPLAALPHVVAVEEPIDLLLTDFWMPGMHGGELVRRAWAVRPDLPVLLMSSDPIDELAADGFISQSIPALQKPFPPSELIGTIRELLPDPRMQRDVTCHQRLDTTGRRPPIQSPEHL